MHETFKLVDRSGAEHDVQPTCFDRYRINQLLDNWQPAGTVCCYLGIANPFGFSAETHSVKLVRVA